MAAEKSTGDDAATPSAADEQVRFFVHSTEQPADPPAEAEGSPRISHLETTLLGETYPKEKPEKRLARLETRMLGSTYSKMDLCSRTDNLEEYLRTTSKMPTINEVTEREAYTFNIGSMHYDPAERELNTEINISKRKVIVIAAVSTVLLGALLLAGPGLAAGAGGMAAVGASGMAAMGPPAAVGGGMMGGGMMGGGMMGGGMMMLPMLLSNGLKLISLGKLGGKTGLPPFGKKDEPKLEENRSVSASRLEPGEAPQAVPAGVPPLPPGAQKLSSAGSALTPEQVKKVKSPNPPGQEETLQVKVSWCEYQIFGKTFDSMKMIDRLMQLNKQLIPQSKKDKEFKNSIDCLLQKIGQYN